MDLIVSLFVLFLKASILGYIFQIGVFLMATLTGDADEIFDSKTEYFLVLVPFACWFFIVKNVIRSVSKFQK